MATLGAARCGAVEGKNRMSRKKDTRQRAILDQLAVSPTMRVGRLAETLDVTTETIRRDLEELAAQGMIARTYGGAMLRQPAEPALSERHLELVEERAAIGQSALSYLAEARVIMLGSGATTTQLAKFIAIEMHGLTVIAHSVSVDALLNLPKPPSRGAFSSRAPMPFYKTAYFVTPSGFYMKTPPITGDTGFTLKSDVAAPQKHQCFLDGFIPFRNVAYDPSAMVVLEVRAVNAPQNPKKGSPPLVTEPAEHGMWTVAPIFTRQDIDDGANWPTVASGVFGLPLFIFVSCRF